MNSERGAEVSGSRFAYLMREAVLLELALVQWVMGILVREGFAPVVPPVLVREHAMEEAGFFPTDREQVYDVDGGELFLVGTSEVPLSALHRGEILAADALPLRYAGISSNFRREAGTYGKDTRGIFRVHQFDKVEMFSYSHPDRSWEEHERILAIEEEIFGGLGLPYRVVNIAAGDLGAAAAKKYDIEVWLPSEGRYRELTSCSNYLDYSARRLGTRFRDDGGTKLVHTLNGTACAIRRTLMFLFEHYQTADGGFTRARRAAPLHRLRRGQAAHLTRSHRRRRFTAGRNLLRGGVPERTNGTVLKTVEAQVSEGSNPSPSASVVDPTTTTSSLMMRHIPCPIALPGSAMGLRGSR